MIAILAQTPALDWTEVMKFGPAFTVLAIFLTYVITQNKELKVENVSLSKNYIDFLTKAIESINKNSFILENLPATIKSQVVDAIRELLKKD